MTSISAAKLRQNIYKILNDVNEKNAVIISEDDWKAIKETIYLNSIPGMAESIREGGETPIEDCVPEAEASW